MSSLVVLQGRPYLNFINSLKSEETKQQYKKCLLKYLAYYKTRSLDNNLTLDKMLSLPITETENMLIDYIIQLKNSDLSRSYINLNFCALKHFYFMNDVRLNSVKIAKFMGEAVKKNTDRGYFSTEIKTILDNCDLRMKVVVLTLATTSMRLGAITGLTLADVQKIPERGVYKFVIYKNTKEQSICFCSPECGNYIDAYYDYRSRAGDRLEPTGPFIREMFDANDIEQVRKHGKPVSKKTISSILQQLVVKSGLRTINHNYTCRERHEIGITKGLRKWWMHEAVEAKMNPEIREMLLSHSISLASAYYKPSEQEMLDHYMMAVDNGFFVISQEQNLRKKVVVLQQRNDSLDRLLDRLDKLEKEIGIKI